MNARLKKHLMEYIDIQLPLLKLVNGIEGIEYRIRFDETGYFYMMETNQMASSMWSSIRDGDLSQNIERYIWFYKKKMNE